MLSDWNGLNQKQWLKLDKQTKINIQCQCFYFFFSWSRSSAFFQMWKCSMPKLRGFWQSFNFSFVIRVSSLIHFQTYNLLMYLSSILELMATLNMKNAHTLRNHRTCMHTNTCFPSIFSYTHSTLSFLSIFHICISVPEVHCIFFVHF